MIEKPCLPSFSGLLLLDAAPEPDLAVEVRLRSDLGRTPYLERL